MKPAELLEIVSTACSCSMSLVDVLRQLEKDIPNKPMHIDVDGAAARMLSGLALLMNLVHNHDYVTPDPEHDLRTEEGA